MTGVLVVDVRGDGVADISSINVHQKVRLKSDIGQIFTPETLSGVSPSVLAAGGRLEMEADSGIINKSPCCLFDLHKNNVSSC